MFIARHLPQQFDVRDSTWDQHDVSGAIAKNTVGDVNIATAGILDRAFHGHIPLAAPSCSPSAGRRLSLARPGIQAIASHGKSKHTSSRASVYPSTIVPMTCETATKIRIGRSSAAIADGITHQYGEDYRDG